MNSGYAVYRPLPSAQHLGLLSAVSSTYVAISYVWGDPTLSRSITINGASLPVTESAFDALMSLRRVDAQVTVWIDAICINQLDLDEKPLQVQFMDRIYACAKQTVVWPGLPADRSDQVMRFADSLDSVALSPEYDRCSVEGAFELGWTTKSHIPDLLAGEVEYSKLEPHLTSITRIQSYRIREQQIRAGESTTVFSCLNLLYLSRGLQATDPRDKIFAMRNLASDLKQPRYRDWVPKPGYRISWQAPYTDMAMALLENDSKQFLNLSGILRQGEDAALPSWVPDFRQTPWVQYIIHPRWSADGTQRFVAKLNRVFEKEQQRLRRAVPAHYVSKLPLTYSLTITTLMEDAVEYLGGCIPSPDLRDARSKRHQDEASTVLHIQNATLEHLKSLTSDTYLTLESNLQAYKRTLIANTTDPDTLADESFINDTYEQWQRCHEDLPVGEYRRILGTLGSRNVVLL